jgi:hypothetical protein
MPPLICPPFSSFAAVMYAALLHVIEAMILLSSTAADGSIGMAALLRLLPDRRVLAASLIASAVAAFTVLARWSLPAWAAVLLLAPQQAFLLTTAIAAWLAVWHGSYADGVLRSSLFITADQLPRGMFSLIHLTAIYGIAAYHVSRPPRR